MRNLANVAYSNRMEDLEAFALHYSATSKIVRRGMRNGKAWAVVASLGSAWIASHNLPVTLLAGGITTISFHLLYPAWYRHRLKKIIREANSQGNNGVIGRHTLTLTESALLEENDAGSQTTVYRALLSVAETPEHVFIYTTSSQAHVVPKAAIETGDIQGFVGELKRRIAADA
jgi:hypothetical protein